MNNTKGNPQQKRLFWLKKCEDFLIRIGQDPPIPDICHFFTLAKFLENKIYTEKRQFFALNL